MKVRTNKYKLGILLGFLTLYNLPIATAQQVEEGGYIITNVEKSNDITPYKDALKNINLADYRKENSRKIIRFNSGFEIMLLSFNEFNNIEVGERIIELDPSITQFTLTSSGKIISEVPIQDVSQSKSPSPKVNTQNALKNSLPPSFPKYVNTGNAKEDQKRYHEAKQNWINNNPEIYKNISSVNQKKQMISKAEYQKMPKEKQKIVRKSSNKYVIEQ